MKIIWILGYENTCYILSKTYDTLFSTLVGCTVILLETLVYKRFQSDSLLGHFGVLIFCFVYSDFQIIVFEKKNIAI